MEVEMTTMTVRHPTPTLAHKKAIAASGRAPVQICTASAKIIALYDSPDNAFGANAVVEVLVNEHILKATAGI